MPPPIPPHFFKVFLSSLCSQQLRIPSEFVKQIAQAESLGGEGLLVSLRGPSGTTWSVQFVHTSDNFQFRKGWKDFVADNSIQHGDVLVFCMDEPYCFSVTVFDTTACEKLVQKTSQEAEIHVVDIGREKTTENSDGVVPLVSRRGRKRKAAANLDHGENTPMVKAERPDKKGRQTLDEIPSSNMREGRQTLDEIPSSNMREGRQTLDEIPSSNMREGRQTLDEIPSSNMRESRQTLDEIPSSNAREDHNEAPMEEKNSEGIEKTTMQFHNGTEQGKGFAEKRRPVTEVGKSEALRRAELFESNNPSAVVVMQDTYVSSSFYMLTKRTLDVEATLIIS